MKDLVLHVKREYFEAIKDGSKPREFRLRTDYWTKRLQGREYSGVQIHCGYPPCNDKSRILRRPWRGYEFLRITHKHFGIYPVEVYAIVL